MSLPILRISRGRFAPERYSAVRDIIERSAESLVPALKGLRGLLYYHAAVDEPSNTVVNVSLWTDMEAATQMDSLAVMLAQRPVLEQAGVQFDRIANYEPLWTIDRTFQPPR